MTTMYDIARDAGVSQTAVSFVLNNDKRSAKLKKETRERVLKSARKLNYRPNLFAKSLSTGKSYSTSVIISSTDELTLARVAGFESYCRHHGYIVNFTFATPAYNEDEAKFAENIFSEILKSNPAGVAFFSDQTDLALKNVGWLKERGVPYITFQLDKDGIDSVLIDRTTGINEAVKYLYDLGYERIAYLGKRDNFRLKGYQEAVAEKNKEPIYIGFDSVLHKKELFEFGERAVEKYLEMPEKPDAVQCYSDEMALGFISGLHKNKVRIPEDVAVIGFDDIHAASMSYPLLTTVRQSMEEAGVAVAKILLSKIKGEVAPETGWNKILPTRLIVRNTT